MAGTHDPQAVQEFFLKARLDAIQDSIKRTRLAVFVCIVGSLASLVCIANTVGSIDRLDAFRLFHPPDCTNKAEDKAVCDTIEVFNTPPSSSGDASSSTQNKTTPNTEGTSSSTQNKTTPNTGEASTIHEMHMRLVDNWMDSTYINVPVLGIRVSVMDSSIYNSLSMILFTLFLVLCERRENREVGRLLQDVHDPKFFPFATSKMASNGIYRLIMAYMIFNLGVDDDTPIDRLDRADAQAAAAAATNTVGQQPATAGERAVVAQTELFGWRLTIEKVASGAPSKPKILALRIVGQALFWLPFSAVAASFVWHICLVIREGISSWANLPFYSAVILGLVLEVVALFYTQLLTRRALGYHKATGILVQDFYRKHCV